MYNARAMDTSPLIQGLNEPQQQAVTTVDGPVLIIAGAGSGKTRALTHRIAYLIQERHVRPWNILAMTFTNKAAAEMRKRIIALLGVQEDSRDVPFIGTFHSFCVKMLRKHIHLLDYENQFAIYDASDQQVLMKRILKEENIDEKQLNPRAVLSHISTAKNGMIGPREYEMKSDSYFAEKVARLYYKYEEGLKKNNALDFDDLLLKVIELFQKQPGVLEEYRERFRYIHVDEYQDTNHAQYMITKMLAEKYKNLCVVGDSDQGIYSWRGASIQNILDFEKDYPQAQIIKLEQNYRSTKPILDVAHHVISQNTKRHDKKLWTAREEGKAVQLHVGENERHEAETVAKIIRDEVASHERADYRDFTVLYRTNAQSRTIEEVFMRWGLPYKIIGGIRFYERKEIKDIMAYLKIVANPADSVALLRIVNTPQRSIGPASLEKIQTLSNAKDCTFFEAMRRIDDIGEVAEMTEAKREHIKKFVGLIQRLQRQNLEVPASALIKFVMEESGYKKYLDDGSVEGEARLENVAELISVASKYDKLAPGMSLNIFLEEVSLISDIDTLDDKDNSITLMTLHMAKGLEFPHVFITGMEDGMLPHSRSILSPQELEEERRLFYVGVTRAMEKLHLLYAKNRMFYGETRDTIPSQFLDDIPSELLETQEQQLFGGHGTRISRPLTNIGSRPIPSENLPNPDTDLSDGDKVMHKTFGEGIVINVLGGIVTVAFKDPKYGIKKLAITVAPLEKI